MLPRCPGPPPAPAATIPRCRDSDSNQATLSRPPAADDSKAPALSLAPGRTARHEEYFRPVSQSRSQKLCGRLDVVVEPGLGAASSGRREMAEATCRHAQSGLPARRRSPGRSGRWSHMSSTGIRAICGLTSASGVSGNEDPVRSRRPDRRDGVPLTESERADLGLAHSEQVTALFRDEDLECALGQLPGGLSFEPRQADVRNRRFLPGFRRITIDPPAQAFEAEIAEEPAGYQECTCRRRSRRPWPGRHATGDRNRRPPY
jgi:hypothetical protein